MSHARPKYQVFISSTYEDLRKEREAATWTVLKQGHIPVGMEAFPANDDRVWKTISRTIDDSDYYVLILAGRYGSVDPETGLSWTHREYNYAQERKVPVLTFLRSPASIVDSNSDKAGARKKLDAFKRLLKERHLVKSWDTSEGLCALVGEALSQRIQDDEHEDKPRPGWYRGATGTLQAIEEFARLSAENARLREDLHRAEQDRTSSLEFMWDDQTPILDTLPSDGLFEGNRPVNRNLPEPSKA